MLRRAARHRAARPPRARRRGRPDSAAGLDVPYCSRCMRHAEAWDHAGVGSAAVLVVGVLAFIASRSSPRARCSACVALVASIPVALVVANARRARAKAGCTEACAAPGMALAYHGFNGTLTSIAFESLTYAARFAEHNTGIVLETPQLRRLLEGHRIARLQVPTPAAAVSMSAAPTPAEWRSKIGRRAGLARRTALSRALDAISDEAARADIDPRGRRCRARAGALAAQALRAPRSASTSRPRSPRCAPTTCRSRCRPPELEQLEAVLRRDRPRKMIETASAAIGPFWPPT